MLEKVTIARPYAQASFALAVSEGDLNKWAEMLGFLSTVVQQPEMHEFCVSFRMERHKLVELLLDLGAEQLTPECCNLIKVLADNHKIGLLPEIYQEYLRRKSEHEGCVRVEVVSTFEVDAPHQQQITDALKVRLGKKVELIVSIDPTLLGGWLIRIGDQVLDLSVRGRLNQFASALRH